MQSRRPTIFGTAGVLLVAAVLGACSEDASSSRSGVGAAPTPAASVASPALAAATASTVSPDDVNPRLLRRFQPLAAAQPAARPLVDLGRMLYFDARLSKDGRVACESCHELAAYGVDHRKTSRGFQGKAGTRNAPTVYNAAGQVAQFWDGRAADLEEQARGPMVNPVEMAMPDGAAVTAALKKIPGYAEPFARAFPESSDPVSYENASVAIGAFERGLVTPGRWDDYLRGDKDALTAEERRGLKTFLDVGCMVCHTGPLLGGSMFERAGSVEPWPNQADLGREAVTHAPADRMMFKVPSLRNVEKTAPYFHDGSAETLEEAVKTMGRHQLGLDLSKDEVASIVTWLKSLTSPLPSAETIARPVLPGSK